MRGYIIIPLVGRMIMAMCRKRRHINSNIFTNFCSLSGIRILATGFYSCTHKFLSLKSSNLNALALYRFLSWTETNEVSTFRWIFQTWCRLTSLLELSLNIILSVFLSVSDLSNIKEKIDSEKEIAIYLLDILYLKKYFGFVLFNCHVLILNI